jgi:TfoX/Sxy family transcriptional regulator of competence genes
MTAKAIIAKLEANLTPLGVFRSRPMFGGHGLYLDDLFFGLIAYDKFYLKTDEQNRGDYVKAKVKPFSFESTRKGFGRHILLAVPGCGDERRTEAAAMDRQSARRGAPQESGEAEAHNA